MGVGGTKLTYAFGLNLVGAVQPAAASPRIPSAGLERLLVDDNYLGRRALETSHIQSGEDGSKIKKDFDAMQELIGLVAELVGETDVFRFAPAASV